MWPRSPAKAALGEGESDLNGIFTIRPVAPQHRRGTVDVGVTEGAAAPALAGGVEERSTAMMGDWDHGRMMGGGYGGLWIVMVVFWILLLGLITFLVVRLLPGGGTREGPPVGGAGDPTALPPQTSGAPETPEQILDRLFALGEIDEQTYRSRRTALAEMRREP